MKASLISTAGRPRCRKRHSAGIRTASHDGRGQAGDAREKRRQEPDGVAVGGDVAAKELAARTSELGIAFGGSVVLAAGGAAGDVAPLIGVQRRR